MGDHDDTFSAIHRETEKLLRWKEATELMNREKRARLDHYKKATAEQVKEICELDGEVSVQKDKLEAGSVFDIKVKSMVRQREAQTASKNYLTEKMVALEEGQEYDAENFDTIKQNMDALTSQLDNMTLEFLQDETKLRNSIEQARDERESTISANVAEIETLENDVAAHEGLKEQKRFLLQGEKEKLKKSLTKLAQVDKEILHLKNVHATLMQEKSNQESLFAVEADGIRDNLNKILFQIEEKEKGIEESDQNTRAIECDIEKAKKTIVQCKEDVCHMEKDMSRLNAKSLVIQDEKQNVTHEIEEEENVIAQLRIKEQEFNRLKDEYSKTTELLAQSDTRNVQLQAKMTDLKGCKREQYRLNSDVLDLEKQMYEEEETFRVKMQYAEANAAKVNREKDQRTDYNQDELQIIQDELNTLTARYDQLDSEVANMEASINQFSEDARSSTDESANLKLDLKEREKILAEIESKMTSHLAQQNPELASRQKSIEHKQKALDASKQKEREKQKIVHDLSLKKEILEGELADHRSNLETNAIGVKSKGSQNAKRMKKLSKDILTLDTQIQDINTNIQNLETTMANITSNTKSCGQQKKDLEAKLEDTKKEHGQREAIEATCRGIEAEIQKLRYQMPSENQETGEAGDFDVAAKNAKIAAKEEKLKQAEKEEMDYRSKMKVDLSSLEASNLKTLENLNRELVDTREDSETVDKESENLEAQKSQLSDQIQTMKKTLEELQK